MFFTVSIDKLRALCRPLLPPWRRRRFDAIEVYGRAEADLTFPIILSAEGHLMDGGHRIAKAWLLGRREILAVQFVQDPAPDHILPPDASLHTL